MANLRIETDYLSEKGLTARRRAHINGKSFEMPTAAVPIGRASHQDTPADVSRGVVELYRQVSTEKLEKSMRSSSSAIADALRRHHRKTTDDEVVIAFASYQDAHQMGRDEMEHLIDLYAPHADVLPVPLMPGLVGTIDTERGIRQPAFQSYRQTIDRYIKLAKQRAPDHALMAVIPPLGWEFIRDLMQLYGEHGLRAFCLNLNRSRVTSGRQVAMVTPLMQHLARQDILNGVFTYLVNPDPYGQAFTDDIRPAADMSGFGMGIDVVGDCHIAPGGFDTDEPTEAPDTFRLLKKDTYTYEDVPLDELKDHLPADTGFDRDRVVRRAQDSPESGLYQMQKLVNMEQMALGARKLRTQSRADAFDHLSGKAGVTPQTIQAYQTVRDGVDDGGPQTGLTDF